MFCMPQPCCLLSVAAVSLGIACGVPLKAIVAGIEAVDIIPGRCEIIDEGQPFAVVVSPGGLQFLAVLRADQAVVCSRAASPNPRAACTNPSRPQVRLPTCLCSRLLRRLTRLPSPRLLPAQVDSACTPDQLGRLLDDVKEAGAKRVLLVFGCPGTTSKEQRAAMMRVRAAQGGAGWCGAKVPHCVLRAGCAHLRLAKGLQAPLHGRRGSQRLHSGANAGRALQGGRGLRD